MKTRGTVPQEMAKVAVELAKRFTNVYATDISQKQLDNAALVDNIHYSLQRAEESGFADNTFSLITVAQALHWFNFEAFNAEVKRVLKPRGIIAVWLYDVLSVNPAIDKHFMHFYKVTTNPYWDAERIHIDEHYKSIPFPFIDVEKASFVIEVEWDIKQFEGYLNTWSGVQKFITANNYNPVDGLIDELKPFWPDGEIHTVKFPVYLQLGINK
ncbi:MAG: class I SAM-dependent methyltransferase [Sphingobacteriales bacterium JAD_PAG50586_3]|nr:MAG: class I SAM-dependent methyltransferase [Sphingobacteriales bacterium JAD_PAG50586_3]